MKRYMIAYYCLMSFFAAESKISAEIIKNRLRISRLCPSKWDIQFMDWSIPTASFFDDLKTAGNDIKGAITIVKYAQSEAFLEFPDLPYGQTLSIIAVRLEDPRQKISL